ncbi:MAG: Dyp-type peroxidase [Ginsengibacter sp.]
MERLELSEIQGFLVKDYNEMPFAKYFLLKVTDAQKAKVYLNEIARNVTSVVEDNRDYLLNIGFTSKGLLSLGLHENNLRSFIREFREGMVTPHRQRLLGDFDSSDPATWIWGGPNNQSIDLIILLFEKTAESLQDTEGKLKKKFDQSGLEILHILSADTFPGGKEHFGFRDGISQPAIIGSGAEVLERDNIKAGEFVLGYKNEYNVFPDTPLIKEAQGNMEMLADDPDGTDQKDLGRNGTYFVLRQLKEDVNGFWNFLNEKSKNEDGSWNPNESTKLAAKMMGRWPSGASLVKFPDEDPGDSNEDNDFVYTEIDKHGFRCPIGSHSRRTNPRDNFEETGPAESLKLTRKHRLMRRVRSYGEKFVGSATQHSPVDEVGILFGCFNADINRQFEFIQYTWANYPKFKQLYADPDPFIGVKENPAEGVVQQFTIPQETHNKYIDGLKSFVTVKGGAYFFFPSLTSLKYLSTI